MSTATALGDADKWRRSARTWGILAVLYAVTACCVPVALVVWHGYHVTNCETGQLCRAIQHGPNKPAAIEEARHRALQLLRAIRSAENDEGRSGLAARNAAAQIKQEALR